MIKHILVLIIIFTLIYLLIKKIKKNTWLWFSISLGGDDDFNKIKTISGKIGTQCQECLMESGKCCDNCSTNEHHSIANSCQEHNHSHNHHHHEHNHIANSKDLILLLFLPILLAVIFYKFVKFLRESNNFLVW